MSELKDIVDNIEADWRGKAKFLVESIYKDCNGDYVVRVSTPDSRGEEEEIEDDRVQSN